MMILTYFTLSIYSISVFARYTPGFLFGQSSIVKCIQMEIIDLQFVKTVRGTVYRTYVNAS